MRRAIQCVVLFVLTVDVVANCPHRWLPFDTDCYRFIHEPYNWFDAQEACRYMGAKLVEIESDEENQFVSSLVQSHDNGLDAWIGLEDFADEGVFVWTSTREPPDPNVTFWYPGEPTDSGAEEDCVYIWKQAMWVDQNCEKYTHPFVCEMPSPEEPIIGR